jgi:ferrous iron transport protein B
MSSAPTASDSSPVVPDRPAPKSLTVALIGNPNTGKSTLFNALSGLRALTGNYPGCTVEKKIGKFRAGDREISLIDLPGTYSLAPRSLDEMIAVNVLLGRQTEVAPPDVVLCIVDASNLERHLYLVSQVLDLGRPVILALNMVDVAAERGVTIDVAQLQQRLDIPVVAVEAHRGRGVDRLRDLLAKYEPRPVGRLALFPEQFLSEQQALSDWLRTQPILPVPEYFVERLLLDVGGYLESHLPGVAAPTLSGHLTAARARLAEAGCKVPAVEARVRYAWVRKLLDGVVTRPAARISTWSDRVDRLLTHRVLGLVLFVLLMLVIFTSIYQWAGPLMELCEAGQGWVADQIVASTSPGMLRSLLVDGVIGGVGGVLIFLPQIVILFLFIAILEDCGYLARAAFLMDKLMTKVGLSGKSFLPLMSSFACAIPGVMATRVIENRRDRFTTILVAPLMSCSARQPVYALMIAAFIPAGALLGGWLDVQSLTLVAMTSLGAIVAVPIAWLFKSTLFRGETPPFVMELPPYKWPSLRMVFTRVYASARSFVVRAGTLIFATSVLIWAAGYFPGDHREKDRLSTEIAELKETLAEPLARQDELANQIGELAEGSADRQRLETELDDLRSTALLPLESLVTQRNVMAAKLLEQSYLGRFGHALQPLVQPLGWDWKIGVGVIASFPAREVIVATLGTIYSLGGEVDEADEGLKAALRNSTWPDGRPVFDIPVALSIMVFFALCAQCASTLMVIRRETNSRFWPLFTFVYMTGLAYAAAWVTVTVGRWIANG